MVDAPAARLQQLCLAALAICVFAVAARAAEPPCNPVAQADLRFEFSADPTQPTVGDDVSITVRISNPGGSAATRPQYALLGFRPIFDGDLTPTSTGESTLGTETLTYHVKAMQAGTAALVSAVNYSTPAGCREAPITQFTNVNSSPFKVTVVAPTPAPAGTTACPTLAPCAVGFVVRCADEAGCVCTCIEGQAAPTCEIAPAPELTFEFAANPPRPTVGDTVTLSVIVRNTTEGVARRPQYSLQGVAPIFSGDFSPTSTNVGALGNDTVTYTLTAADAGTAQLGIAVSLESVVGCRGTAPSLTNVTSPTFALEVVAAPAPPAEAAAAPPAAAAAQPAQATPTAPAPAAAAPAVLSNAPAETTSRPAGSGCGGSCSASTADGAWPLVLLALLFMLRRRRNPCQIADLRLQIAPSPPQRLSRKAV